MDGVAGGQNRAAARLDRHKITNAALRLLDEVGLDALSTRLLATRLGVKSPALYWHFRNKQELVDAMAEAMLDAADWPDGPLSPDEVYAWLAARAHAFRRALLAHRDGARVHAGTRPSGHRLASVESQVAALVAAGLAPADAARGALALSRYTVGWVLEEQAGHARADHPDDVLIVAATPAPEPPVDSADPERDFDFGVRALLAGLAQAARPAGRTSP